MAVGVLQTQAWQTRPVAVWTLVLAECLTPILAKVGGGAFESRLELCTLALCLEGRAG